MLKIPAKEKLLRNTHQTVGWATFGCGAGVFGVRGQARQAKRHPFWLEGRKVPAQSRRRRRCALP